MGICIYLYSYKNNNFLKLILFTEKNIVQKHFNLINNFHFKMSKNNFSKNLINFTKILFLNFKNISDLKIS